MAALARATISSMASPLPGSQMAIPMELPNGQAASPE
jgi:hypothetical protein